jgi:hypothetical protein
MKIFQNLNQIGKCISIFNVKSQAVIYGKEVFNLSEKDTFNYIRWNNQNTSNETI